MEWVFIHHLGSENAFHIFSVYQNLHENVHEMMGIVTF